MPCGADLIAAETGLAVVAVVLKGSSDGNAGCEGTDDADLGGG